MEYIFGASGNNAIGNRKLQVRIGPSIHSLTICNPNDEVTPHFIDSPYFVGHIVVRIKDFRGITPKDQPIKQATEYFGTKKRLFALQVCGRFKHVSCLDSNALMEGRACQGWMHGWLDSLDSLYCIHSSVS